MPLQGDGSCSYCPPRNSRAAAVWIVGSGCRSNCQYTERPSQNGRTYSPRIDGCQWVLNANQNLFLHFISYFLDSFIRLRAEILAGNLATVSSSGGKANLLTTIAFSAYGLVAQPVAIIFAFLPALISTAIFRVRRSGRLNSWTKHGVCSFGPSGWSRCVRWR